MVFVPNTLGMIALFCLCAGIGGTFYSFTTEWGSKKWYRALAIAGVFYVSGFCVATWGLTHRKPTRMDILWEQRQCPKIPDE